MKRRVTVYALAVWLAAAALAVPFRWASAQSGRPIPQPRPTQTPQAAPPQPAGAKQDFAADPGAEKYKLIFPVSYDGIFREGKVYYVGEEADLARPSRYNSFIEQLNKAGERGYRLASAVRGLPVAIVRLDEARYEYAWFQTTSDFPVAKAGFEESYAGLAKRGFRVVSNLFISKDCEDLEPDESAFDRRCAYKDLFLLERMKGAEEPVRYVLAQTAPQWSKGAGDSLTSQVSLQRVAGFHPAVVFSKFQILLERGRDGDELSAEKPDVRVVTSSTWGRDFEKNVNELAKQGYRLALTKNSVAVMYKGRGAAAPASYVWLDAEKKGFEAELAKLQEKGAVYRMVYPSAEGDESKLVFELGPPEGGRRREYKVFKFEFADSENPADRRKVNKDLTPASKETLRLINSLAKEGFVVRDLFMADKVSVLLERSP